jgi:hypothetical protein
MKDLEVIFVNRFKADTFERWLEARPKFEFERVELDDGSFVFLVFEVSELEEEEIRRESGGKITVPRTFLQAILGFFQIYK